MGIYYNTQLYYGRLLSLHAYNRIRDTAPRTMLRQVAGERFILHAPGQCIQVGFMDPAISDQAKDAGEIRLADAEKCIQNHEEWREVPDEQLRQLDELVARAADDPGARPGLYVCEAESSTLEDIIDPWDGVVVKYNLRVV